MNIQKLNDALETAYKNLPANEATELCDAIQSAIARSYMLGRLDLYDEVCGQFVGLLESRESLIKSIRGDGASDKPRTENTYGKHNGAREQRREVALVSSVKLAKVPKHD